MVHNYDTLVIGGGLAGLIAAHQSAQQGKRVALVERDEELGTSDFKLEFLPAFKDSEKHLQWLEQIVGAPLELAQVEIPPVTFEGGSLKPFVGFGNDAPKSHREVSYYASAAQWSVGTKDWVEKLRAQLQVEILPRSTVTAFKTLEQNIVSVVINGGREITAGEFIWTASPHSLKNLLSDSLAPRVAQKLAKGPYFASVQLEVTHAAPVTDSIAIHILRGGTDEPVVGRFSGLPVSGADTNQQSRWVSFIPSLEADNEELVASQIKYMKRQITRPYPSAFEGKVSERLVLANFSHGQVALDISAGKILRPTNLRVCHPALSPSGDLLGTIEAGYDVFASAARVADDIAAETPGLL